LALAGCDNNTTTPNNAGTGTGGNSSVSGGSNAGVGAGGGNVGGASNEHGAGTGATGTNATGGTGTGASSDNSSTSPDNTGVNTRDRDGNNKTPIDQQETTSDVKITADIRMKIVNQEGMSINARNVKIITKDGKVTLRGPVNSEEEKKTVEGFAKNVAGDGNVDSQLEVAGSQK